MKIGRKRKKGNADATSQLPKFFPNKKCRLRMLRLNRVKDYLLMEDEFHKKLVPKDEKKEEERQRVDKIRGTPLIVGSLEEIIDENHAIVSPHHGSEYYTTMMSFVDKDILEPGCSVLLNNKNHAVVGVMVDDTDPMVRMMKVDKAPEESYADVGGLDN